MKSRIEYNRYTRVNPISSRVIYIMRGIFLILLSYGSTKQFHVSDTRLIKLITNSSWSGIVHPISCKLRTAQASYLEITTAR